MYKNFHDNTWGITTENCFFESLYALAVYLENRTTSWENYPPNDGTLSGTDNTFYDVEWHVIYLEADNMVWENYEVRPLRPAPCLENENIVQHVDNKYYPDGGKMLSSECVDNSEIKVTQWEENLIVENKITWPIGDRCILEISGRRIENSIGQTIYVKYTVDGNTFDWEDNKIPFGPEFSYGPGKADNIRYDLVYAKGDRLELTSITRWKVFSPSYVAARLLLSSLYSRTN